MSSGAVTGCFSSLPDLIFAQLNDLVGDRKGIQRVNILFGIPGDNRRSRRAQHAATRVSAKLDLSRSVRSEHFIEPEIKILVAKLVDERRQVNRVSIVDARFIGHSGQRRDVDFAIR